MKYIETDQWAILFVCLFNILISHDAYEYKQTWVNDSMINNLAHGWKVSPKSFGTSPLLTVASSPCL